MPGMYGCRSWTVLSRGQRLILGYSQLALAFKRQEKDTGVMACPRCQHYLAWLRRMRGWPAAADALPVSSCLDDR